MDEFESVTAEEAMAHALDELIPSQMTQNQGAARLASGIRAALDFAAANPHVYTDFTGDDGRRAAEGAALLEVALRVHIPEGRVRQLDGIARSASRHLPTLWRRALDGFAPIDLVGAAAEAIVRLFPAVDADEQQLAAAAAAIALVDEQTAAWVLTLTAAAFRRRLRVLIDLLDARSLTARHADALAQRRLIVDEPEDGMAWVHVLLPAIDAIAIKRRARITAKMMQKDAREGRSRDQIRADLASAWLRGVGTDTATKVKVFVTVPVGLIGGNTADADGTCAACGGSGVAEQARIVGGDTIDPLTARQLFLDAATYRRLIVDPVRKVVVDLDRRQYRPTKAQRDLLVLTFGTCARDGCDRLALDSDIDHILEWCRGGPTNLKKLRPLCPPDHTTRHGTRIRFHPRTDRTTQVTTPTGFVSAQPPPF